MGGMQNAVQRAKSYAFSKIESIIVLDASSIFWEASDLTYDKAMEQKDILNDLGDSLADDLSRDILVGFLNARISGRPDYVTKYCSPQQYFPCDLMHLSGAEVVYDCGAYCGDTLNDFLSASEGSFHKYIAIEPEAENVIRLTNMVHDLCSLGNCRIEIIPKGLWDFEGVLKINSKGTCASISDASFGKPVDVTTLDLLRNRQESACTLLKMDIEGAEMKALKGGEQMIRADRPKLAINVCHRPDDLMTIPQFIKAICPDYKFYLRHHHFEFAAEMVLYAL